MTTIKTIILLLVFHITMQWVPMIATAARIDQDRYAYKYENAESLEEETYVVIRQPKPITPPSTIIAKRRNFPKMVASVVEKNPALEEVAIEKPIVPPDPQKKVTQETLTVLFKKNESKLLDIAKGQLNAFVNINTDSPITVVGYTCQLGSQKFNKKLAKRRAESVERYLKKKLKNNIRTYARPKCCYRSKTNYAKNRRVEVLYLKETTAKNSK